MCADSPAMDKHISESEIAEKTEYTISDSLVTEIREHIEAGNRNEVADYLTGLSSADIADLLEKLPEEQRHGIMRRHAGLIPANAYAELDSRVRQSVLDDLNAEDVAKILSELDSDDALDMIITLDEDFQHRIIRQLSASTRVAMEQGLSFPEESAGRLMQREFVAIPQFWTVGKTVDYLRAAADELPGEFFDIFVITPTYHVVGEVPLNRLVRAQRKTKLENLADSITHPIPADMDQEEAALIFKREDLSSAPVVDQDKRLIGVITIDDVVDVIEEEAQEDLLRLAGVGDDDLYSAVMTTTRSRFRWLFINLFTAIAASVVIYFFDATIKQSVALAILMPIVASMGGNAGTQALTVAVRALAAKELSSANRWRLVWKEVLVGILNGLAFAVIAGLLASFWFGNPLLGLVIGLAMVATLVIAGLTGAGIPIMLDRIGSDPAVSSTVVLTTVTDIVGFFAFLGLATIIML